MTRGGQRTGDANLTVGPTGSGVVRHRAAAEAGPWAAPASGPAPAAGRPIRVVPPAVALPRENDQLRELSVHAAPTRAGRPAAAAAAAAEHDAGVGQAPRAAPASVSEATSSRGPRPAEPGVPATSGTRTTTRLTLREILFTECSVEYSRAERAVGRLGLGDILFTGARRESDAGTIADILDSRVQRRGAAGIAVDDAVRDHIARLDGVLRHTAGVDPPAPGREHGCGRMVIRPGDTAMVRMWWRSRRSWWHGPLRMPQNRKRPERFVFQRVSGAESVDSLYTISSGWRRADDARRSRLEQT